MKLKTIHEVFIRNKIFYLPFTLFAFNFEPAALQCMHIKYSVLIHHWWNELFWSVFKWHKSEDTWRFLIKFDDSKLDVIDFNCFLCCHLCMAVLGAAKTGACAAQDYRTSLLWREGGSFVAEMLFIVFSDGQWMWFTSTFKPVLLTHCVLYPICISSLSYFGVLCKFLTWQKPHFVYKWS